MSPTSLPLLLPAVDAGPAEAAFERAATLLERSLEPLARYCQAKLGDANLSEGQFYHQRHISDALDALADFEVETRQLLLVLARNVEALNTQLHGTGAPLPFDPRDLTPSELLARREADPMYRLGFVRGHKKGVADTTRQYERLASLYAQHAVLPAAPPNPSAEHVRALPAFQLNLDRLNYPLDVRQDLASVTIEHLPDPHELSKIS